MIMPKHLHILQSQFSNRQITILRYFDVYRNIISRNNKNKAIDIKHITDYLLFVLLNFFDCFFSNYFEDHHFSLLMQQQSSIQLKTIKQYCKQLQNDFKNNLLVIEQSQQEIQLLKHEIGGLKQENIELSNQINQRQDQMELEIRLVKNQYLRKLQEKDKEVEEIVSMMEARMRRQIQSVCQKSHLQIKTLKNQIVDSEQSNRRLLHENNRQIQIIKELKNQALEQQSQIHKLTDQKNSLSNKMALHEQQLEGIKSCNQSWEEMLKTKLRQAQKEKQTTEEQFSEYKLAAKEKLKRQKEEFGKKIIQLAQEKQSQIREIINQHKQIKYKLQKTINQHKESLREIQMLKQEKQKLENQNSRYKQNDLKTNFQKNQKQYDYFLKIFEQDKKDLRNQLEMMNQDKKTLKEELDQTNSKRQSVQKAVERLKVQLINKSKENDELKKQNRKIRHQFEAKLKEVDFNNIQQYRQINIANSNKPIQNKGFDIIQNVKMENDFSKVFTEDMGVIDDRFFQASAFKSPKGLKNISNGFSHNREAQLMKKNSELQLQMQEYKTLIKNLRQQAQGMKKLCQQDKTKEISLYRDKANIYWEKANDKEQQVMALKQNYNELKSNYHQINQELKRYKQYQLTNKLQNEQVSQLRSKVRTLEQQKIQMQEEITHIIKQRDMLQEISSELRSEVHTLKQLLDHSNVEFQYASNQESNYHQTEPYRGINQMPIQRQQTKSNLYHFEQEKQRIPKKLHDLVREKKMFSISGKRAPLEERTTQVRPQHVGTESQKQILDKIKIRNKTPPKIANYADMKRQKQKRTHQIQTPSQKEVLERLKSKQMQQDLSPQRGINYLQLRSLSGIE